MNVFYVFSLLLSLSAIGNPYPQPDKVISPSLEKTNYAFRSQKRSVGSQILRVDVGWQEGEKYKVNGAYLEHSGTSAHFNSSQRMDSLGSYKAQLIVSTRKGIRTYHASIGTGKEFRRLVRTLSFRFPLEASATSLRLRVFAENPIHGKIEEVVDELISPTQIQEVSKQVISVNQLRSARKKPALRVNFYAEGFSNTGERKFLAAAQRAIQTLEQNIPGSEHFEFRAVFAPSKLKIGSARDLGELKERDSFLGLYFPYWRKFGRWYHVVYPTSETRYRNALAQEPYDYPIALVDDSAYWGVGNYKELTAVPIDNPQFTYLLLHEFGHFMGLNEEYEGGGPTELEFAPSIEEPWSQNITFNLKNLKWRHLTEPGIPIPTSFIDYNRYGGSQKNPVGAYRGGYADSEPLKKSHKPVKACMMGQGGDFCKVCQEGLIKVINHDRGVTFSD